MQWKWHDSQLISNWIIANPVIYYSKTTFNGSCRSGTCENTKHLFCKMINVSTWERGWMSLCEGEGGGTRRLCCFTVIRGIFFSFFSGRLERYISICDFHSFPCIPVKCRRPEYFALEGEKHPRCFKLLTLQYSRISHQRLKRCRVL